MSYLTRKEIDDMKPQIEEAVHKFLGFSEPAIVTTAVNCIGSGYDKRKTAGLQTSLIKIRDEISIDFYSFNFPDKLSALLDEKKAMKLTEKMFIIYNEMRATQKNRKRSHIDEKDKEKDMKKLKLEDNRKIDELPETNLSPDKVQYI